MSLNKILRLFSLFTVFFVSFPIAANQCISVVLSGSISRPFWSDIAKGAIYAGNQLGYEIHVRGTINDDDSSAQLHILKSFDQKYHCQGLVMAPSNSKVNAYVATLKERNIPTVYIDRDTGGVRATVIKTDNFAAGKLAAQEMSNALRGKGNIVLFRLKKGIPSTDARESGFIDEARNLGLKIIEENYLGTRVGEARNNAQSTLQELDQIDGIFTPNDTTTIGTVIVRKSMDKHKNVVHIGFDESPIIIRSLQDDMLTGYIAQSPYLMGYQGVYSVDNEIHNRQKPNESSTKNITTPVTYITK